MCNEYAFFMGVLIVANVLFLLAYCARAIYFAKLFIVKNIIITANDTDIHNIIKHRKKCVFSNDAYYYYTETIMLEMII